MAASTVSRHDSIVSPGVPKIRSRLIEANPSVRAAVTAAMTSGGRWRRPRARSTGVENDCAPNDTRVKPAATSSAASCGVQSSGFASSVTSAPGANWKRRRIASTTPASR